MSKSPPEHASGSSAPVRNTDSGALRTDKVLETQEIKARICRRAAMRFGSEMPNRELGRLIYTAPERISRWRDSESAEAPTLRHMVTMPTALLDELLSSLASERAKLGFETRRWVESEDERAVDRTPQLEAALSRAMEANADLLAIVNSMRVSRCSR